MIGLFSLVLFCYWLEQSVAGRHNGKRNKAWLKCCSMYIRVFHLTIFVLTIKVFQVSFNTPGSISTSIFALTLSDSVPNLIMIILMYDVCQSSFFPNIKDFSVSKAFRSLSITGSAPFSPKNYRAIFLLK